MQTTFDPSATTQPTDCDDTFPRVDLTSAVRSAVVEAIALAGIVDVQACARHLVTTLSPFQLYLVREPLIVQAVIVHVAEALGLAEVRQSAILVHNQSDKVKTGAFNQFLRDLTPVAGEWGDTEWEELGAEVWDVVSVSDLALGPIGADYDFADDAQRDTSRAIAEAVARLVIET